MTNDDAKYREWWEKLKGEVDGSDGSVTSPFDDLDYPYASDAALLRRMLQIEQGK